MQLYCIAVKQKKNAIDEHAILNMDCQTDAIFDRDWKTNLEIMRY